MRRRVLGLALVFGGGVVMGGAVASAASSSLPLPMTISDGWQLQDAAKVPEAGSIIASASYKPQGWYIATVPGTVLTSLVNNGVYPEPLYGENNRPDKIPDSLSRAPYWYRTVVKVPKAYAGRHVWLNFDGINYSAQVWVNGRQVGAMQGAFIRGIFDISPDVKPGKKAVVAVLVTPQPHPGVPHEHTHSRWCGQEWRHHRDRWADVSFDDWLGLDSGDSRPGYGNMAEGVSLGDRAGGGEGSAGDDRSSAAEDRFGGCCGAGDGWRMSAMCRRRVC